MSLIDWKFEDQIPVAPKVYSTGLLETIPAITITDIGALHRMRDELLCRQERLRQPSPILAPVVTAIEMAMQQIRSLLKPQDPEPIGSDW